MTNDKLGQVLIKLDKALKEVETIQEELIAMGFDIEYTCECGIDVTVSRTISSKGAR